MAREKKHWEVKNSNMTLSHKDGKLWLFYVQHVKVKSKWKTYWLLCFVKLTTRENWREKKCVENIHSSIVWFGSLQMPYIVACFYDFWTPCIVVSFCTFWMLQLWKVTFGVFKTKRKKQTTMIQIRRWSGKAWCHEKRGLTQEKITWRQTKLWSRKNYLKRVDKEISKHIDIKGKKDL